MLVPKSIAAAAAVAVVALATPAMAAVNIVSTLDTTLATNASTTRTLRDGNPSTCGAPKAFPGTIGAGTYAHNTHTLVNNGPAQCVTVTVTANCPAAANNVFLIAYSPPFDPSNLATNYLADTGSSTGSGVTQTLALNMTAGQTMVLAVESVAPTTGGGGSCSYTIISAEADLAGGPVGVPTMTEWAMIGLASALAALGGLMVWNRRRFSTAG